MSGQADAAAVKNAQNYYNSDDAEGFYQVIWGGEDIHIGLYEFEADSIFDASRRTVHRLAELAGQVQQTSRVLDCGSGYCGAARYLAQKFGCSVAAVNLSEVENERARALNAKAGLDGKIDVVDGSFEELAYPDASFDLVWSQDAILHSARREVVVEEVSRVLKSGGRFVFTDPMQADDCPDGVLQPILDRIHLQSLGSPKFYREVAVRSGLVEEEFLDLTPQLVNHYTRVLEETSRRTGELQGRVSADYIERMKQGLKRWIEGGERGYLTWGMFRFRKA